MIAVFIFSVILTIIYTSYTGTFRVIDETEYQSEIYQMARTTLERMIEDLESVYISTNRGSEGIEDKSCNYFKFAGEDQEIDGKAADSLQFISMTHLNLSGREADNGPEVITYYAKKDDNTDNLVLYRISKPVFESGSLVEEENGGFVLSEGLLTVNFTYYDSNGEASDSWDILSDTYKDKIPKRISILLEFINRLNPDLPIKFMSSVSLPNLQG